MNSNTKTRICDKYCIGCETYTDIVNDFYGYLLCINCNATYENKTGYCSLDCCLSGHCDDSC